MGFVRRVNDGLVIAAHDGNVKISMDHYPVEDEIKWV